MSHLWRNKGERWTDAVCAPASSSRSNEGTLTPTRSSIAADISRSSRMRNGGRLRRKGGTMATQAKCQTLVNTEDDKGEPCGKVATFVVKGRPGYPWFGQHCDAHALDVARHMGHQGGSVIVPIGK